MRRVLACAAVFITKRDIYLHDHRRLFGVRRLLPRGSLQLFWFIVDYSLPDVASLRPLYVQADMFYWVSCEEP